MAAKTHTQSPAPISTRFKSKPSFSFHSRAAESSYRGSNHNAEEDWYIPYNGPYEQPPDPFAAQGHSGVGGSKRDSWEEVLTGWRVLENEVVGGGQGSRYGGLQREDSRKTKASGSGKKAGRSRAFSNASSRITTINAATSSQGHGDAIGRKSTTSARSVATTVGAGGRANTYPYPTPPLPTLSTRVDMSGGIGDVPTPVERLSRKVSFNNGDSGGVNRSSFASFITFGRGLLHGSSSMEQLPQQYHHLQQQQQQPGLGRDSYMVTRSGIGISTANPSTNPNTHTTNSHPMDMVNTNTVGRGRANTAAELTPSASASLVVGRGGGVPGSGRQRANTETKERDRDGVEDNEYYYSTLLVHQSINGSDSIQHDSPHHHRHHTTQPTRSQSQPAYSHSQLHSYGGHQEQQGEGKEGHRQGLDEPQHPDLSLRSHPYAIAFPSSSSASPMAPGLFARNATSVFSSSNLNPYSNSNSHLNSNPANGNTKLKSRLLDTHKLSITLLDPLSHNRVPAYLKPSPRNSLLKGSLSTPNLRNVQNLNLRKLEVPKGKQRWLSAETWCDALILPRPRFALRLVDSGAGESLAANGGSVLSGRIGGAGGGNGVSVVGASLSRRIVSPPGSPILPEEARIISRENSSKESYGVERGEGYPTGRGAGGRYTEGSSSNRPLVVERSEVVRQDVGEIVGSAIIDGREGAHGGGLGERNAKPLRPKSWAWDDLAVPSPVPSLSKYAVLRCLLVSIR